MKEGIDFLLSLEGEFKIQELLNGLSQHLNNMVGQPQNTDFQNKFSQALSELQEKCTSLRKRFEPAQVAFLDEIGASEFFLEDFSAQIIDWMQKNPLTPVVIKTNLDNIKTNRQEYINKIAQLRDSFQAIGIQASILKPGDAEIGILMPRSLFDNNFEQLIEELHELRFILRTFSELATGTAEPIEVRQISTSDPTFFFGMNAATIAMVAGVITWALNTWKQVEDIRKLRAEAAKIKSFTEQEVDSIFGKKIKKTIDDAINEKLEAILANIEERKGRVHELSDQLKRSLKSILARIERGLTVEVRFIPPPKTTQEEGKPPDIPVEFKTMQEIIPQLVFPKIEGTPILQLPIKENTNKEKE